MSIAASDLALLSAYTYSKALDDKSAPAGVGAAGAGFAGHMNDHNPALDYGPSDFNVKHRFVNSAVYSLPVGRGKRFLGGMNRAEDLAIGGWQLSVIATFQTGFPFSINAPDPGAYQSFGMRANQVGRSALPATRASTSSSTRRPLPSLLSGFTATSDVTR